MTEDELIETLRRQRPGAPIAPQGELAAILRSARPLASFFERWRVTSLALGSGLALTALALYVSPGSELAQVSSVEMGHEEVLTDADFALNDSALEAQPGEVYLALLESVN